VTNHDPVQGSSRRAFIRGAGLTAFALHTAGRDQRSILARDQVPPPVARTWLLAASDELRPPDPGLPTDAELAEILDYQSRRTVATAATVARWGNGPAVLPWTSLALDLIQIHQPGPVRAARALAVLHAALDDTVLAVRDAAAAHPRMGPWQIDRQVTLLGSGDASESAFPSMHAAIAATAAAVLGQVFPAEPAAGLAALAVEAAESRSWAGAAFRSDLDAGSVIGQAVGDRAIARLQSDGADAVWDGAGRSTGPGTWQPTPPGFVQKPLDPLAGSWRPWVLPGGDVYRPRSRKPSPAAPLPRRRRSGHGLQDQGRSPRPVSGSRMRRTTSCARHWILPRRRGCWP
jgi:membrane-associated phospholipid phosphatase